MAVLGFEPASLSTLQCRDVRGWLGAWHMLEPKQYAAIGALSATESGGKVQVLGLAGGFI